MGNRHVYSLYGEEAAAWKAESLALPQAKGAAPAPGRLAAPEQPSCAKSEGEEQIQMTKAVVVAQLPHLASAGQIFFAICLLHVD